MVIFHSYVNVYQRVIPLWKGLTPGDPQPAMKNHGNSHGTGVHAHENHGIFMKYVWNIPWNIPWNSSSIPFWISSWSLPIPVSFKRIVASFNHIEPVSPLALWSSSRALRLRSSPKPPGTSSRPPARSAETFPGWEGWRGLAKLTYIYIYVYI